MDKAQFYSSIYEKFGAIKVREFKEGSDQVNIWNIKGILFTELITGYYGGPFTVYWFFPEKVFEDKSFTWKETFEHLQTALCKLSVDHQAATP